MAMLYVAMLNKLKMAKWWAYHTGTTSRPITVDKRMLYRSAIKNEMRNHHIHKLVEGSLACAQDDVWQSPEIWLKSDLNGPAGNIFYLMGVCNCLVRELRLSAQLKREYKTEINSAADYQSRLTVMQKWFGIVFVE